MYSEATGPKSCSSLERLGFKCLKSVVLKDLCKDKQFNPWEGVGSSGGFYEKNIENVDVV